MSGGHDLQKIVSQAIHQECERIIAEEAQAAADRVVARIRDNTARLAMSVMTHFQFDQMREHITISVDTRGLEKLSGDTGRIRSGE